MQFGAYSTIKSSADSNGDLLRRHAIVETVKPNRIKPNRIKPHAAATGKLFARRSRHQQVPELPIELRFAKGIWSIPQAYDYKLQGRADVAFSPHRTLSSVHVVRRVGY